MFRRRGEYHPYRGSGEPRHRGCVRPAGGRRRCLYRGRGQVPLHGADEGGALWGVQPGGYHSLGRRGRALYPQSGETVKLQSVSQSTETDSTTYQTVWQLTDEPDAALDIDKTDALLAALASYVTGQDTAADLSACGFDAPLVTAEVTTADGTVTLTYAIGTDGYYMMVSGDSSVYTVDGQTVQALCLTARQLKADT